MRRTVALSILLSLTLAGCSQPAPVVADLSGGTLYLLSTDRNWMHLDPQRVTGSRNNALLSTFMHRTLTSYRYAAGVEGTQLQGDLAINTGIVSQDAKQWTFRLRDHLLFDDGTLISCLDVKYGVARNFTELAPVQNPVAQLLDIPSDKTGKSIYKGPYVRGNLKGKAAFDAAVTCSADNRSISFHLNTPRADFNHITTALAFAPVPVNSDTRDAYDRNPVSSGPYTVDLINSGADLTLRRNEHWDRETDPFRRALPQRIVMRFGNTQSEIDNAITADFGEAKTAVSLEPMDAAYLSRVFNDPNMQTRRLNEFSHRTTFFVVNQARLPCVDLRKAIALVLDHATLQRNAGGVEFGGEFADSLLNPHAYTQDYAAPQRPTGWRSAGNVDAAKAAFAAAAESCKKVYNKVKRQGLLLALPYTPQAQKDGLSIQESMSALGLKLKLRYFRSRYYTGSGLAPATGDFAMASLASENLSGVAALTSTFFTYASTEKFKQMYSALSAASAERDTVKRALLLRDAMQVAVDDVWVIPSRWPKVQLTWGSRLAGVYLWTPYDTVGFNDISITRVASN